MKKFLSLVAIFLMAIVLVGCEDTPDTGIVLKRITISLEDGTTGTPKLTVGKSYQFKAEFDPADYQGTVEWSTSDEKKMTVDQTGKVNVLAEEKNGVYLYAECEKVKGSKKCKLQAEGSDEGEEYPNLGGYNIKIAQADTALGEYDPNLTTYKKADREARLEAWDYVQSKFNCTISVVPYPGNAEWGPSRWQYILSQASDKTSDYDFLTVPDSKIPEFVEGKALIDVTNWYTLYGNNSMDPSFITSGSYKGKLYLFTESENNIYNVMYYNVGLLKKVQEIDSTIKEPAEIFLEGGWTYTAFVEYCKKVKDAMAQLPKKGEDAYYPVSGWNTYWFIGLAGTDGEPMADLKNWAINLTSDHKTAAAQTIKDLTEAGCVDPKQGVDGSVASWSDGRSLFNTGDLWFVNASDRWPEDMWGKGETQYGYVPWPMADDMTLEDYRVQLGGTAGWVMPIGRNYEGYGEECTAENIYYAMMTASLKTKELYEGSSSYDADLALQTVAQRYCATEKSQEAYIYINGLIKEGKSFYDPLSNNDNPIGSLYASGDTLRSAVDDYVSGDKATWSEAVITLVPILKESMQKAFS